MTAKRDRISEFLDEWRTEHPGEPFAPALEEASSYRAAELRSTPLRGIRSWLTECQRKKSMLEKEFPHLKRVPSPMSERYEDLEYNLCELLIPRLGLEIERRGRGTNEPDRSIARDIGSISDSPTGREFKYSPDYRSVTLRGETYALTLRQSQIVQLLHQAHNNGTPDISIAFLLEKLETQNSRWQDSFKGNVAAKKALITSGSRKGTLRLKL